MSWHFPAPSLPLHGHDMLFNLVIFVLSPLVSPSEYLPVGYYYEDPIFMTCACMLRAVSLAWKCYTVPIIWNSVKRSIFFHSWLDHGVHELGT